MKKAKGSYIYLYRKILDNKKLFRDTTSFVVFLWILLRANYKTGEVETGRFVAALDIGIKPTTFYQSLKRLKKMDLIDIRSNNKYSIISVTNWHDFQGTDDSKDDNKMTTSRQQDDTIQGIKEVKEYKDKTTKIAGILGVPPTDGMEEYIYSTYKDYVLGDMTLVMKEWCENKKVKPTSMRWMNWVRRSALKGELERRES